MDEKKLAIIATKGSLDWAYPPFILASTAAALGYETEIFFTFYGLQLLKKDLDLGSEDLKLMDIVLKETERLNVLVGDFLAYARPPAPRF